ncbi:hypothetical protein PGTUg99_007695 [Puccinia graminis f. sp. tritici]|uniref:Uncharacterized protein n=1 Tax=Puccinia graminis f. sp. tritici TaxID=56615 RepID=A0A5B0MRP6_PUCGR|nr:hypothetical protein PGTUg99_007695 [Puccinia graminis f. sp. tritici]
MSSTHSQIAAAAEARKLNKNPSAFADHHQPSHPPWSIRLCKLIPPRQLLQ